MSVSFCNATLGPNILPLTFSPVATLENADRRLGLSSGASAAP